VRTTGSVVEIMVTAFLCGVLCRDSLYSR